MRGDPTAQRSRPGKLNRAAFLERAIRLIGEGETATGAQGFDRMARLLAAAMGVRWAFISEVADDGQTLSLLALWSAPSLGKPFEYGVSETPCEQVLMVGGTFVACGLLDAFPDFTWGREIGAESYIGAALYGPDQTLLGHIGVMHDEALDEDLPLAAILRIFRERAAAELVRTRTEADLRASSERYRRLVEASPDALFRIRLRPDFAYEYVSPAFERLTGYSVEELYSDPDLPLRNAHPGDRELGIRVRKGEVPPDKWIRRSRKRDGTLMWSEMRSIPVYDGQGNLVAIEGVGRDITELMETRERLEAQEEAQRKVLEAIPEQIVRVDRDGTVASVIPTGWKGKPLAKAGQKLRDVVPRKLGAELQRQIAKALETESVGGISFRRVVGGDEQHVEMRLISAPGDESYCIIRDTTGDVWLARETEIQSERESLETNVERVLSVHQAYGLSFRELTVLQLIAQGETDRAISHKLSLSLFTVNKHVSNILGKMGVSSRTEASVLAASEGLLT